MLNLKRYIYTYVHTIQPFTRQSFLKQVNCKNAKIKCKLSFYNNKLMNDILSTITKRYLVFGNIIIIKDNTLFHFIEVEFLHFP